MPKTLTRITWPALAAVIAVMATLVSMDPPARAQALDKSADLAVRTFPATGITSGQFAQVIVFNHCRGDAKVKIGVINAVDGTPVGSTEAMIDPSKGVVLDLFKPSGPSMRRIFVAVVGFRCKKPPEGGAAPMQASLEIVDAPTGATIRSVLITDVDHF